MSISKPCRTKVRIFEGSFCDAAGRPTTTVRWATRSLSLPDGPVEGRLRMVPRITYGIGQAVSSVPERAHATLELVNGDRGLSSYITGSFNGDPALEYRGDSFLNLKGRVYACYLLEDGTYEKYPLTPTLCCAGSPIATETVVTLPMAADDSRILGRPRPIVRVGALRDAEFLEGGDWHVLTSGWVDRPIEREMLGEIQGRIDNNLDAIIPYAYGRVAIPLVQLTTDNAGPCALFVSRHRPYLRDGGYWWVYRDGKRTIDHGQPNLWSARLRIRDDEENEHDLWLVVVSKRDAYNPGPDLTGLTVVPTGDNPLSAGSGRGAATPPNLARWIVEDLSEARSAAVDAVSFDRATAALPLPDACGGLVSGDGELRELLTHIGAPWGLSWWVGLDDRLHVGVPGQWTAADRAAMRSPDTPRITAAAFAGGYGRQGSYQESIPADPEERGAAARKVSLDWTESQRRAWPADELPRWAPGATELSVQPQDEARLSAAWLYPPTATRVLALGGARRAFPTRRITLHLLDEFSILERGAICLLSMKTAAPGEYVERVLRLEHTADDPREYVVARFEDLGAVAAQRPALFDSIGNWVFEGVPAGAAVSVLGGSDVVTLGVGFSDPPKLVGMHLHLPGGHAANRTIARRIVEAIDATHYRVDFPCLVTEVIPGSSAGTPPLQRKWRIEYTQVTRGNQDFLTCADEATGAFSDGTPGFTVAAG